MQRSPSRLSCTPIHVISFLAAPDPFTGWGGPATADAENLSRLLSVLDRAHGLPPARAQVPVAGRVALGQTVQSATRAVTWVLVVWYVPIGRTGAAPTARVGLR